MKFTLLKCAMFLFGILLNIPMSVFSQRTFVHPGGVHNRVDLDRIKEKVLAKESPWIEGWNLMIEDSKAQYTYKAAPAESVSGPSGRRQRAARDGVAAYYNFLRWYVTGDERHAECAVNILNDWSAAVNGVITGELYQLPASIMVQVAEVVRAYPGWKADDIERFKKMCKEYFYPACKQSGGCGSWSGWDGPSNTCNLAIGIFCDDEKIYNEAVDYYKHGVGGGCLTEMVNPRTYQVNEMGRDTPHAEIGPGSAAELCQMAWNQGDDLFGLEDNLLLKGFEYMGKYNLDHAYDEWEWKLDEDCAQRYFYYPACRWRCNSLNSFVVSNMPANEIIYNHYAVRKGLDAPYTKAVINARGLTACGWEAPGYTAFTYTLDAAKSPFREHTLPSAPLNVRVIPGLEEVVVSWQSVEGEVINGALIQRAPFPEGPFQTVGTWSYNTTNCYADTTVIGGKRYYYRVAEVNKAGTGAYSDVVSAIPCSGRELPEEWSLMNLSGASISSEVSYNPVNNRTFKVYGTGSSFGGKNDNVTYLYVPVKNNSTITMRLFDAINSGDKSDRTGIMMRESLDSNSKMASIGLADDGFRTVWFAPRASAGANASWMKGNTHTWLEVWFKLVREGNLFKGYQSQDGVKWFEVGSMEINMSGDFYVGIFVASYNSMRAFIDQVTVTDDLHPQLPAPTGLKVEAENSTCARLEWLPVEGAYCYKVSRSLSPEGPFEVLTETCENSVYTDMNLSENTYYYYEVRTVNVSGDGKETATVSVKTPSVSIPGTPERLRVLQGSAKAYVSWKAVDEAESYTVYRAKEENGAYDKLATIGTLAYTDNLPDMNGSYYYKVSASNKVGEGPLTSAVALVASELKELRLLNTARIIGTPGSWGGMGNTCDKAMDGNIGTYFDSDVDTNAWVGLDLGSNMRATVSRIGYAPRSGYASRLYGGCFQLADNKDFIDPVTFYCIDVYDTEYYVVSHREVDINKAYRYMRYLSSGTKSNCNISEVEFWGYPIELKPQTITFESIPNKSLTDSSFELSATASSGLPVSFSSSDPDIAKVEGNRVYLKNTGRCEIYADQEGDDEYAMAERVVRTLLINPTSIQEVTSGTPTWSVSPNLCTDYLIVSGNEITGYAFYAVNGYKISEHKVAGKDLKISVSHLTSGMYLLKLTNGTATEIKKFIKR